MGEMIDKDQEHLRLLSIFHYIYGGVVALFACFPIIHLMFGIAIVSGVFPLPPGPEQMPAAFGWVIVGFAGFLILVGWTIAGLVIAAGRLLSQRRGYLFCMIVAGLECLMLPLGTVLGVFTLIVLSRASVKQMFESVPANI